MTHVVKIDGNSQRARCQPFRVIRSR